MSASIPKPGLDGHSPKGNFASLPDNLFARYAIGILAAACALSFRALLDPLLGDTIPYVTLFAGVAFAAWYCGAGPAVLTAALGLVGVVYWFFPPLSGFGTMDRQHAFGILAYLCFSTIIIVLGEANRRSHRRLEQARRELEQRVQERTRELEATNFDLIQQSEIIRDQSARLLQLQDEERRRIARELHDSVGQSLAALKMNIESLYESPELASAAKGLGDSAALIDEISREIRTISHLLHPPMLEDIGLASALTWYTEGFSERSKIQATLELPPDLPRLQHDLELCIFRIVQEALTNVHRHSGSSTAAVRVSNHEQGIRVEIQDHGNGIPRDRRSEFAGGGKTGVGIRGMRERVRQLGGSLQIHSDDAGTIISAVLPSKQVPGRLTDDRAAESRISRLA